MVFRCYNSILELRRHMGINYRAAWLIKHNVSKECMVRISFYKSITDRRLAAEVSGVIRRENRCEFTDMLWISLSVIFIT